MASDTNNGQPNADFIYRLTLGDMILSKDDSATLEDLVLEQKSSLTFEDNESKQKYKVTLRGVKVNKKIYQPTEIEAELDFTSLADGASTAPSIDGVSALLLQRQVKLELLQKIFDSSTNTSVETGESYTVAENCYVYELDPLLKRYNNGVKLYVKLNIFSMDKLMTLNKYSKAYVARKLGSGILKPESYKFGKKKNSDRPLVKTHIKDLKFLKYDETVSYTDKDNNQFNATIPSEFIQPYLVQYNESFYDFLVRTANRCGEFLYFEDGSLILGLPDSSDSLQIEGFETATRQKISSDPMVVEAHARDSMKDGGGEMEDLNHSAIDKESTGFPSDAFAEHTVSNAELANDEYFFPLFKGKFSNLSREIYSDGSLTENVMSRAFPLIETVIGNETAGWSGAGSVAASEIFVTEGLLRVKAEMQAISVNMDSKKKYMKPYEGKVEQYDDDKVVQFSSLKEDGWTTIKYYNDIHKHESEQQRLIVCIDMGTKYIHVKLGQKIKISGLSGSYVVIQIRQISEDTWTINYDKYDQQASDKYSDRRSLKIYAIPSYMDETDDNKEKFIPPVHPVPVIRKAGPQTAFVTDNVDPKYQGRVRVAYPWQTLDEDLKNELAEAEQRLKQVVEEKAALMKQKAEQLQQAVEQNAELKALKAYASASEAERKEMLEDLKTRRQTLVKEIEDLEASLLAKKTELAAKEAEIEATKIVNSEYRIVNNKTVTSRLMVEEKLASLEVYRRDFIAQEIKDIESKIAEKNKELEKIDTWVANMKAAAAERDDPAKSDTLIARKLKAYELILSEEKNNDGKLSALVEKIKDRENEKEGVKKFIDNTVVGMSTPWIRVASPMATPGGGAFFRPRVGDEVLINFDSDNVERPYVVGSLYSKNTLTPDEGLYRKAAPVMQWKNLSMQLMSPNGHHITFTDPSGGNCFITNAISPGMGYYATILPGISTLNAMGEEYKDLAGGIHIGDRYGMYEIEMKSHKRSIDINSPFGTVSINAFSGITISAPNGNVKIKGKNITLEAGNKISMISGQNIEDPDIGDPEGTGNYVGKKVVSVIDSILGSVRDDYIESIVDFSLIRHVVEVFARPVDGTMLLKSKRFLKLEAGPGNATIRRDRYNASQEMGEIENFYKLMLEYVDYISKRVNSFFGVYSDLWITGRIMMIAYQKTKGYRCLSKGKEPDILAIVEKVTEWKEDTITYDNTFKDGGNDRFDPNKFKERENIQEIKNTTLAAAKDYAKSIVTIKAYVAKFNEIFDEAPEKKIEGTSLKDLLKQTVDAVFPNASTDWDKDIAVKEKLFMKQKTDDTDFFEWTKRTVVKRKLILAFLYKVSKAPFNVQDKYIKVKYDINYIKDTHVLNQEYYWKRQVQIMDHTWQKNKLWRTIWENTVDAFKNKFWDNFRSLDLDVWSDKGEGEILFSDHEDSTLNFEGTGLHEEKDANIGTIDHLKEVLMGVK